MSARFRTEARSYWIYGILDEINETAYVGKSYAKNPKKHYYSHMRGEHSLTCDDYLDTETSKANFYILERLQCSGRIAFKHVLAWYNYFEEQGYVCLTENKVDHMVENLSLETQEIYDQVCAPFTLDEVLTRKVVEPLLESDKDYKKQDKEKLVQFNMRVSENVAQAFRAYCKEKGTTQSEGLRFLLMGEDFAKQDLMIQSYYQEFSAVKEEKSQLKKQNKELLEFKKGEESWVMQQRKAWINIAESMLSFVIRRFVGYQDDFFERERTLGFKNSEGYEQFLNSDYPTEGGCYQVHITGRVRGLQSNKTNAEQSTHTFICGELEDNTRVKFRWINQKKIIGIKPTDEEVTYWGPNWLIGCIISKDGAADVVCAVPLAGIGDIDPSRYDKRIDAIIEGEIEAELLALEDESLDFENGDRIPSLDDMIAAANRRKRQ